MRHAATTIYSAIKPKNRILLRKKIISNKSFDQKISGLELIKDIYLSSPLMKTQETLNIDIAFCYVLINTMLQFRN